MSLKEDDNVFYVDHSLLSTYLACHEKGRLAYVEHLRLAKRAEPLTFGSAFHAGVASWQVTKDINKAELAFLKEAREGGGTLDVEIEGSKRSVERGLNLLHAYAERWKDEPYEVLSSPTGKPYVEIGFRLHLCDWQGTPVIICGLIDSILRSKIDGSIRGHELKTTTQSLTTFQRQAKPNHQVTLYDYAITELIGRKPSGMLWDSVFISDRKPAAKGDDEWLKLGIDLEKDFNRVTTVRSKTDHDQMLQDLQATTMEFLYHRETRPDKPWVRNTGNCHQYGGCDFRDVCISNNNAQVKKNFYVVKEWKPWEGRTVIE